MRIYGTVAFIVSVLTLYVACEWDHNVQLDTRGNYHLFWSVLDDEIAFEVQVQTEGYIGFGISPKGGMKGADIVIGWVNPDANVVFHDRHATSNSMPVIDDKQDWTLLEGWENDTHTALRFKRKLNTCDDQDIEITDGTVRVIWSYGDHDPSSPEEVYYHGRRKRGTKKILLLQFPSKEDIAVDETDLKVWDVLAKDVTLSNDTDTLYWCWIVKAPVQSKHHIVKLEPIIKRGHEALVHHYLLWMCRHPDKKLFDKYVGHTGHRCYTPNMPTEYEYCDHMYAIWSIGGETQYFPKDVGLPLGEDDTTYFVMEIHYDNREKMPIKDSSGWRVYYTPKLRKYDGFTQDVQVHFNARNLIIPPQMESFTAVGHCDPTCFQEKIPETGLNVFAIYVHSHDLGRKIRGRHFRGGKELDTFIVDNSYDFNYQEIRYFKEERKVLPGDQLTVECTYDSTSRDKVTLGGPSTSDEMCSFFFFYYPKMKGPNACLSRLTEPTIMSVLGVEEMWPNSTLIKSPQALANQTITDYVKGKRGWTKKEVEELQRAYFFSKHRGECFWRHNDKEVVEPQDLITYPVDDVLRKETTAKC